MQDTQERMQRQQAASEAQLAEAIRALACTREEAGAAAHATAKQLVQAQVV